MLEINCLEKSDLKALSKLLKNTFGWEYDQHGIFEQEEEYFSSPNNGRLLWRVWTAKLAGKLIGVSGLYQVRFNKEVWLGWYCINKKYRGQGHGEKLLRWTIEEAKKQGYLKIKLYTSDDKYEREAQYLYEKLGLEIYRKVKCKNYTKFYRAKSLIK